MPKQLISFCAGDKVFVNIKLKGGGVNPNPPHLAYALAVRLLCESQIVKSEVLSV